MVKRKETPPEKITLQQILKNEQRQQRSAQIHISTIMLLSVTLNAGEKHNKEKKVPLL